MPNKTEKKDSVRPLSDDEGTFTFDLPWFAPTGAQGFDSWSDRNVDVFFKDTRD